MPKRAKCPRNVHPHDASAVLKHLTNRECKSREILRGFFYTLETFPHKISAQSDNHIDGHFNWKNPDNLQTFAIFSKRGFTR